VHRVAILAILALIFLTVTGITVAQERTSNHPEKGDRKGESLQEDTTKKSSTNPNEQKGPAEISEAAATKTSTKDRDKGLAENNETTAQPKAQNSDNNPEAKKRKSAENKTAEGKSEEASETEDANKPPDKGRPASVDESSSNDKPNGVGKPTNAGGRSDSVGKPASKPAGVDNTEDAGKAKGKGWAKGKGKAKGSGEAEVGSAEGKVIVCHVPPGNPANAHEITVGAPAVQAHIRHGDKEGSCAGQP
jgi:cytoskeletal protein RodZ